MKMITKRGIFLWILAIAFLFGLGFMTYSLVENGDTWVMKTYNTHIYKNGDLIGAGTIKSADGAVLAETKDGKRVYAEDPTVRKATLHTVGDTKGFISSGIQSVYKADLTGYNLLFGVYSIERYGKGNNMQLTIDSRVCAKAYSLLSDYKAGTVGVVNYKTGDIVCAVSTPSYDMEDEPSDLNTNSAYEGVYINRLMTGLYTPGSTFKLVTAACAIENIPDLMDRTWECTGEYDPGKGEPIQRDKSECLVDLRVDAFIPEKYIADGPGRIEAYKRIAAIQTPEDAADVLDELIDRYGDPPPSVSDLVSVSLVRVQAAAVGVYEVTQKKDTLLLQVETLDVAMIRGLLIAFNGRVTAGAGTKPYLSVTLQPDEKPLELLQSILKAMADILAAPPEENTGKK